MSEIKTAGEWGTELGERCLEIAKEKFREAIRPIYIASERGHPVHEGSCVLLEISGKHLLLTPAHVVDAGVKNGSTLYVGGEKSLIQLEGDFWVTKNPEGGKDRYDFAVGVLSEEMVNALGDVRYVAESEIAPDRPSQKGRLYSIIGYPNTKNKSINRVNYSVTSTRWHYFNTRHDNPALCKKIQVTGEDHLFIGYDKKQSLGSGGNIVGSVSPVGVSGGAVFDLGNFGALEKYDPKAECTPQLAGLFIEFHHEHHATVATKISVIINAIRGCGLI